MRALLSVAVVAACICGAYVVSPFYAAYTVMQAVKTADTETLERKVNWPSVRRSLKGSIARDAQLRPAVMRAGRRIRPSLWQRVKAAFGASMVDRFVETYVTPAGLPQLYNARTRFEAGKRLSLPVDPATRSWTERLKALTDRLKRAEFLDWRTVELEIRDRFKRDRHIISTFERTGFEWRLTRLRIMTMPSKEPGGKSGLLARAGW
ncbi:MAG: DUF2939 domain-containing protein [Pseudomonadota bacterium]